MADSEKPRYPLCPTHTTTPGGLENERIEMSNSSIQVEGTRTPAARRHRLGVLSTQETTEGIYRGRVTPASPAQTSAITRSAQRAAQHTQRQQTTCAAEKQWQHDGGAPTTELISHLHGGRTTGETFAGASRRDRTRERVGLKRHPHAESNVLEEMRSRENRRGETNACREEPNGSKTHVIN